MAYKKIIKQWAKLRHPDPEFSRVAIRLYESLDERDRNKMLKEFEDYIAGVAKGDIIPSMPKIPIRVFKRQKLLQDGN